jgi:nucleotide-binding universal stress UspA family protein
MNPIICVTDFTEHTLEAARTAAAFARHWGERVVLVRSVDEREQFPYPLRSRLMHQDWRRLAGEARQLRQLGFDCEEKVLRGMPEDGIAAFAWKSAARLVVVGGAPTPRLEHWALGCMAEEISDTSLVPVLAVRSAAPFDRWLAGDVPLKVLVGVDPAARPDAMLNRLDELRQLGSCAITASLVAYPENKTAPAELPPATPGQHPFTADRDQRVILSRELAQRDITIAEVHAGRDVAAGLVAQAEEADADLLVVTTHPHDDLTLLPHRSISHGVLRRAPMSVLCVPEPAIEPPCRASIGQREQTSDSPVARSGQRASTRQDRAIR